MVAVLRGQVGSRAASLRHDGYRNRTYLKWIFLVAVIAGCSFLDYKAGGLSKYSFVVVHEHQDGYDGGYDDDEVEAWVNGSPRGHTVRKDRHSHKIVNATVSANTRTGSHSPRKAAGSPTRGHTARDVANATVPAKTHHTATDQHHDSSNVIATSRGGGIRTIFENGVEMRVRPDPYSETHEILDDTSSDSNQLIDLVSLTVRADFPVLFNSSALASWLKHIQNIRSVTFIGPADDYSMYEENMREHYPGLVESSPIPIRWVNEAHWQKYRSRFRCPYPSVCQQLIKLYVFDLRTKLKVDIGENVLVVDSDTVWARDATFVHSNGTVTYHEVFGTGGTSASSRSKRCSGMDPVEFTEGITIGTSLNGPRKETMSPYTACIRPEYPNASGGRHIVHHMMFQYDVMMNLHKVVKERWVTSELWEGFQKCYRHNFCQSRIAEYELYFAFVSHNYPERVNVVSLTNEKDYMAGSAICSSEEMKCCEDRGVLLKGCHDHRILLWEEDETLVGDMCCQN
ncbi:hypothetical protein THAOC_02233 [Thalassiosira oceanica]|uniref:Uncharacterized protein n=1 Tax=Thalassiosira oceanica TaxID=159749 RepID=K0TG48_THAOC|nr:hypothetical protein THAOC_02233 [Thalassiosira oceanica]|eukprot:EJK76024.1 hypothetical protein THAOC_02233 [Thalassiosira oceanica]